MHTLASLDSPTRTSSEPSSDSSSTILEDIEILKTIAQTRASLYLAQIRTKQAPFVIKFFPKKSDTLSSAYLNESRFQYLSHPNIIKYFYTSDEYRLNDQDGSLICMESAKGDFIDLARKIRVCNDEKLVRTLFRNLVDALEYLHSQGIAHLDVKPENLLLGVDLKLRLADFDNGFQMGDENIRLKGTKNFRAPELVDETLNNPFKCDVYSAGVTLFAMRYGWIAYNEDKNEGEEDLMQLLLNSPEKYVESVEAMIKDCDLGKNEDFRDLFLGMTKKKPEERIRIKQVKMSKWYKGPIYDDEELKAKLKF